MNDDIETLRNFLTYGCGCRIEALAALDRIVADRDSWRKALDDRHEADKKAWRAIMRAAGRERGLPDNKEVVAFYVAEVERLEKELATANQALAERWNETAFKNMQACVDAIERERDSLRVEVERLDRERDEWKSRAQQFQRERAELSDKLNGTPCAEIRWQYERGDLSAKVDRLEKELSNTRDAIKIQNDVVLSSVEKTIEARKKLPCGHHASSLVKSVESDAQFCEVCDLMSQRNDAVAMEAAYRSDRDSLRAKLTEVEARNKDAEANDMALRSDIDDRDAWLQEADADLEKAIAALRKIDGFEVNALDSMVNQVFRLKNMARAVLAELSVAAPAQQTQISDDAHSLLDEAIAALEPFAKEACAREFLISGVGTEQLPIGGSSLTNGDLMNACAVLAKLRSVK